MNLALADNNESIENNCKDENKRDDVNEKNPSKEDKMGIVHNERAVYINDEDAVKEVMKSADLGVADSSFANTSWNMVKLMVTN